jgi:hypothetical protein
VSNDSAGIVSDPENEIATDARLCMIRRDVNRRPVTISVCDGKTLQIGSLKLQSTGSGGLVQVRLNQDGSASLVSGKPDQIRSITAGEKSIHFR